MFSPKFLGEAQAELLPRVQGGLHVPAQKVAPHRPQQQVRQGVGQAARRAGQHFGQAGVWLPQGGQEAEARILRRFRLDLTRSLGKVKK